VKAQQLGVNSLISLIGFALNKPNQTNKKLNTWLKVDKSFSFVALSQSEVHNVFPYFLAQLNN
jgi:hypothetical protein